MEKTILIYDIASVPKRSSMEEVIEAYQDYQVVIYDSTRGDKPRLVPDDVDIRLIDSNPNTEEK